MDMDEVEICAVVVTDDLSFANRRIQELASALAEEEPSVSITQRRANESTMDLGATLAILLSSGAVIAIAKGIADWLRRRPEVILKITLPDGLEMQFSGSNMRDRELIEALKAAINATKPLQS